GLLLTEEDLSAVDWLPTDHPIAARAKYFPSRSYEALRIRPEVADFRYRALAKIDGERIFEDSDSLVDWAKEAQLDAILTAEPTIGHWPEIVKQLRDKLAPQRIDLYTARHWWDETLQPQATKGFFRFKKSIPKALEKLPLNTEPFPES
ncbi:MAG TPA: hypothetical protein VJ952_08780, partial [Opitutales bacterium]|nr:hypothetical protein [Opitutales bacterium]